MLTAVWPCFVARKNHLYTELFLRTFYWEISLKSGSSCCPFCFIIPSRSWLQVALLRGGAGPGKRMKLFLFSLLTDGECFDPCATYLIEHTSWLKTNAIVTLCES